MSLQFWLNDYSLTIVVSGRPVEMETPEVEMGDDTGTAKESWEGLGDEEEDRGKNKDEDESEDEEVSAILS